MMKKVALVLVAFAMLTACKDKGDKTNYNDIAPQSNGRINHATVVVSNEDWTGDVGEAIRDVLAAPVDALPQEEPLFTIKQIPEEALNEFALKSRLLLIIKEGQPGFSILDNKYAKPQQVALVRGNSKTDIINQLKENTAKIIESFKNTELAEKQRRINLALSNIKRIEDNLGVEVKFPSAYRISNKVQNTSNSFFWAKKNIPTGSMNLLFYEVPLSTIKPGDSIVNHIIKMRDSIGKVHIPGPTEGTYQITEKAFSPFFSESIIDNKPVYITKGTWEVEGAVMAGPFINYAVEDKINNRYVVIEGFTYSPSVQKRDFMFELETVIKSLHIK